MIPCLDHGYVSLVDHMGDDLRICQKARVLPGAAWRKMKDEALINYLMTNRHTSPFEAVVFEFEVKAPIFVLRQWQRHRTWSYNEESARYKNMGEDFYVPEPNQVGVQSLDNKQGRFNDGAAKDVTRYINSCSFSIRNYYVLIAAGWPRELARCVLPVSMYSTMMATVNLHNLFHFLTLRQSPHAQYEIRVYADALASLIEPIVPISFAAWKKCQESAR